jgi:DNA-binding NtrC family response regulator
MANILVVDDEIGIRELLSEILGDEGHVVELAENAAKARELRAASKPDLVLLDIWMPDTDGVTLLKEWQQSGLLTMPVIMMSGHATIDTAVEATRVGAVNFLEKPISLQKLLKAVKQGLSKEPMSPRMAMPIKPMSSNVGVSSSLVSGSELAIEIASSPNSPSAGDRPVFVVSFDVPLRQARDAFERIYFEHHLLNENASMTRVAQKTGLERTHLYRKLKQLGIEAGKAARRLQQENEAAKQSQNHSFENE